MKVKSMLHNILLSTKTKLQMQDILIAFSQNEKKKMKNKRRNVWFVLKLDSFYYSVTAVVIKQPRCWLSE